jgi:hypothetical protein
MNEWEALELWLKEQDPRVVRVGFENEFVEDPLIIIGRLHLPKGRKFFVSIPVGSELLADEPALRKWCLLIFRDTADWLRRDHMITTALGSAVWAAIFCVAFCAALSRVPGMLVALLVAVGLAVAYHVRGGE